MKDETMFKLNSGFQKEIFEKLIHLHGDSIKAGEFLGIPPSSIRAYKNLYSKTVPIKLIEKLISLKIFDDKKLNKNVLEIKNKSEIQKKSLDVGRDLVREKFKGIRERMPDIEEITKDNKIEFSKWLKNYLPLVDFGFRKFEYYENENYIELKYNNFTNKGQKDFKKKFPKEYVFNDDLSYFMGLWCGDRSGGKRFGIVNQNKEILEFSEKFLLDNLQNVERILYCSPDSKEPEIRYDKKVIINNKYPGWAISLHTSNGILSSFFNYLLENLEFLLKNNLNKNAFFAGLFDAEGNVSLYNKSFRWACKNKRLLSVYEKYLRGLNLYKLHDGACIISYNRDTFFEKIHPYLKHSDKKRKADFLCNGNERNMPWNIREVLDYITKNPLKTQKEITERV